MNNFEVLQFLDTGQRGVDVIAIKGKFTYYIEAKGETSSKKYSRRFGKAFSNKQIGSHVSRAVLAAMTILNSRPSKANTRAAIALPDTPGHRSLVQRIERPLRKLGVLVFWVTATSVRL
jgi:hypothetical protein